MKTGQTRTELPVNGYLGQFLAIKSDGNLLYRISGDVSCYKIRWKLACQEQNYEVDGYLCTISCHKSGGILLDRISVKFHVIKSDGN